MGAVWELDMGRSLYTSPPESCLVWSKSGAGVSLLKLAKCHLGYNVQAKGGSDSPGIAPQESDMGKKRWFRG